MHTSHYNNVQQTAGFGSLPMENVLNMLFCIKYIAEKFKL